MNTDSKLMARILGVALMSAGFLIPKAFAADPGDGVRMQTVKYGDLNVNSPAGAMALYQRIHQAAMQVCGQPGADVHNLTAVQMQRSCMARAESSAVDKVHSGALSAYYQRTQGHPYTLSASNNVK